MKTFEKFIIPEGKPEAALALGAMVYEINEHTQEGWVVLPLSSYFKQDSDNGWNLAGAALIEAKRLYHTSMDMGHPSGLIGVIRRWFRDNPRYYDILEKGEDEVFLIIRPGNEHLMDETKTAYGKTLVAPISRWSLQIVSKEEKNRKLQIP